MASRPLHGVALCAGAAGLELGLHLALGDQYRTVCYVEREAFAAATLVARMADQALDPAPVWDDLTTFDGRPWRSRVDLVSAGFPCPPFSQAGQRGGADDVRYLWPDVRRTISDVGPRLVYLENVAGFVAHPDGLRRVAGELAEDGFDTEWMSLATTEVGGSQERQRVFVLAYRDLGGLPQLRWEPEHDGDARHDTDGSGRAHVAQPDGALRGAGGDQGCDLAWSVDVRPGRDEAVAASECCRAAVGDPAGPRCEGCLHGPPAGREGSARPGAGLPIFPPLPDDLAAWGRVLHRAENLEPSLCRVADGMAHRLDRLHCTGNGVVALVAAYAFVCLAGRVGLWTSGWSGRVTAAVSGKGAES